MKQQNKIWTTISYDLYGKIVEYKKANNFSTVTKVMLFVIKSHFDSKEDYLYNSKDAKTLMMTVDEKTYKTVEALAEKNSMSISKYVRNVLNSYFS